MRQAACMYSFNQAVDDGLSLDPRGVGVGHGDVENAPFVVGDMLAYALVGPGHVAVRLIVREDGAQVRFAGNQCPVEDFAAQRPGEAFADRVHAGRLDGADQDPGVGCLEGGVERCGEVRAAVADQELMSLNC